MESPKFSTLLIVSLTISGIAAALYLVGTQLLPPRGLGYIISLTSLIAFMSISIKHSPKPGKFVFSIGFVILHFALYIGDVSDMALIPIAVCLLSLSRSYFLYSSAAQCFLDFILGFLGVLFSYFALIQTESLFLVFWCFFLSQSICLLAASQFSSKKTQQKLFDSEAKFATALGQAEYAIRKATR